MGTQGCLNVLELPSAWDCVFAEAWQAEPQKLAGEQGCDRSCLYRQSYKKPARINVRRGCTPGASVRGLGFFLTREQKYNISEPAEHPFGTLPSSCYTLYLNTAPSIAVTQPFNPSEHQPSAELPIDLLAPK